MNDASPPDSPQPPSAGLAALSQYQYVPAGAGGAVVMRQVPPAANPLPYAGPQRPQHQYLRNAAIIAAAVIVTFVAAASIVPGLLNGGRPALPADVQVLGDAIQTAKGATSYHLTSTVSEDGHTIGQDVHVATGNGFTGSVTLDGQKLDLIVIGADMYVRANLAFWTTFRSPEAQTVAGKWVKVTSSDLPAQVSDFVNQSQFFDKLIASAGTALTNEGPTRYEGQRAIAIAVNSGEGATIYVSDTTPSYPIALVGNVGSGTASISFDNWDLPVTLTAPPGAIDAPQPAR